MIAKVEREPFIAPDILPSDCVWLCVNLHFIDLVVAPADTVASAERALAMVDVVGHAVDGDGDGAAVAGRLD